MSTTLSEKYDGIDRSKTIDKISERISKREQFEMRRQLDIMINRVKMLEVYKSKIEVKQAQTEQKIEQVNNIRDQYHEYLKQQKMYKQSREQSMDLFREKTKQLKLQQQNLKLQIRESIQNQKRQQFETMKKQQLNHDKVITLQKERSKSYNVEKKQKVQQIEQQAQMNLALYKEQKQLQFKSLHKRAVLDSFKQKAQDFMKIQHLWEKEQDLLDQLNDSQNSRLTSSLMRT